MAETISRDEQLAKALEAIATLPEGEIRQKLMEDLSRKLTTREVVDIAADLFAEQSKVERSKDYDRYLNIVFAVYEMLEFPLDTPVCELPPETEQAVGRIRPLLEELTNLLKKIRDVYKGEGDRA